MSLAISRPVPAAPPIVPQDAATARRSVLWDAPPNVTIWTWLACLCPWAITSIRISLRKALKAPRFTIDSNGLTSSSSRTGVS